MQPEKTNLLPRYGTYAEPANAITQHWNPEKKRLDACILLVGYDHPLDIPDAERLADEVEALANHCHDNNYHNWHSGNEYERRHLVQFCGSYTRGCGLGAQLSLLQPNMQLSIADAYQLVADLRENINILLAVVKGVSRQRALTINGSLIERLIDTADPKVLSAQRSRAIKNDHKRTYHAICY